jgi:hypothetical protein
MSAITSVEDVLMVGMSAGMQVWLAVGCAMLVTR